MAGSMQYLQHPIAQIEHIAFIDQPRGRRRLDPILGIAQRAIRMGVEHVVPDKGA
ncbi:hypothetical protein D3C81_2211850 [compost metagenome]